jgi:hypothetical protein
MIDISKVMRCQLAFHQCFAVVPSTMRLTLKAIDDKLRLGHDVHVGKGDKYFYFWKGETNDWLDRTVNVSSLSSLTLEEWISEYDRFKKLNAEMLSGKVPNTAQSRGYEARSRTSETRLRDIPRPFEITVGLSRRPASMC